MSHKRTALITGCNPGGIGHSLALEFHRNNIQVFATARDSSSALSDLSASGIETISLEVTKDESILAARDLIVSKTQGRGLDFLVNNAGRNYTFPAVDLDVEEVKAMFDVNVFAVMRMCQVFAPLLIQAKGTIVQVGSLAGIMPYVFGSSYNASKAALHSYSDTLRVELAPLGVKVVTVVTGGVKSRIARTTRVLPRDSVYLPIEDDYNRRQQHSQEVGMPNEKYAKSVVSQVLGRPGRRIWEGNGSWIVWFISSYLPHGILEMVFTRMFKLWKLKGTGSPATVDAKTKTS